MYFLQFFLLNTLKESILSLSLSPYLQSITQRNLIPKRSLLQTIFLRKNYLNRGRQQKVFFLEKRSRVFSLRCYQKVSFLRCTQIVFFKKKKFSKERLLKKRHFFKISRQRKSFFWNKFFLPKQTSERTFFERSP